MDIIKKHKTLLLLLLGSVVLSLLFRRLFPLVIYTVGLMVAYFPLKGFLAQSVAFRVIVALVALLCLFQVEAMAFWALNVWVSPIIYIGLSLLIVAAGLWLINRQEKLDTPRMKLGYLDILFLLPAFLVGGVYTAGTLAPAEKDNATIVRSILYGMDDASHANIFADVMRHESNTLSGNNRKVLLSKPGNVGYPMGWHVSASIVSESIAGSKNRTPMESIQVYFYAKIATFTLTIAALTIFVFSLSRYFWPKLNALIGFAGVAGISLFITALFVLPMFFEGFFSFMPIIAFTALFASILIDGKNRLGNVTLLTLLAAASSLTWMLTGPILVATLALYYLTTYGSIKRLPLRAYVSVAVSGIFALVQAYILANVNGALQNISAEGGILSPDHLLLAVSLAVFFTLWVQKSKQYDAVIQPLYRFVVVYLVALALLLLYLSVESSEINYYYYKLQAPLLVILVPLLCVYLFGLLLNVVRSKSFIEQATVLVAGFSLLCLSIPSLVGYSYLYNTVIRTHSYAIGTNDAQLLADTVLNRAVSNDNERTVFMFHAQPPRTILMSNLEKLGYQSTRCDYEVFGMAYSYKIDEANAILKECAPELPPIKIFTNVEGKKQLTERLDPQLLQQHEVTLVVI